MGVFLTLPTIFYTSCTCGIISTVALPDTGVVPLVQMTVNTEVLSIGCVICEPVCSVMVIFTNPGPLSVHAYPSGIGLDICQLTVVVSSLRTTADSTVTDMVPGVGGTDGAL